MNCNYCNCLSVDIAQRGGTDAKEETPDQCQGHAGDAVPGRPASKTLSQSHPTYSGTVCFVFILFIVYYFIIYYLLLLYCYISIVYFNPHITLAMWYL